MDDRDKSKEQLIAELSDLRKQVDRQQPHDGMRVAAALFEVAPLGIHHCDLTGKITFVNPSYESLSGFKSEELVGRYVWDRLPPGPQRDSLPQYFKKLVTEQPPPTPFLAKNIHKDGQLYDVRVDWNYIRDADGALTGFVSVIADITAQVKAERELEQARAELERHVAERTQELLTANDDLHVFKTFAETSAQGFGMTDMNGKVVYANSALARLVGEAHPEDIYGKTPAEYYTIDYQELRETEVFPVLEREGWWRGELTMRSRNGQLIPVLQTSFTMVNEEGVPAWRGTVVTDLREIKSTQQKIEENLKELQAICDGMMDGFNILDMETAMALRVNTALCEMMRYTEEELLQLPASEAHPPEDLPWLMERVEEHAAGRASRTDNVPLVRSDGSVFYADAVSNPIEYQGRRCIMTFFHDISNRKRANEALQEEQNSLRHLLRASDHERELITYEIHDELTQKIAGAMLHLAAIENDDDALPGETRRNFTLGLDALRKAVAEARNLTSRLRTPVLNRFGLKPAIADLIDQLAERPKAPEITYRCEAAFGRLESILENAIFRVVQEALENACRHSKSSCVHVSLVQQNEHVSVDVWDEGVGFDVDKVDSETFGLHGIRERTRLLGSELSIESRPGQGTRIHAKFPLLHTRGNDSTS